MDISVALQTQIFLCTVLLGAALGVWYDVLRAVRRVQRAGVAITAVLDGLFWLVALAALFLFVVLRAHGEGRFYILFGVFSGMSLYFFTCSELVLAVLQLLLGGIKRVVCVAVSFILSFQLKERFWKAFKFLSKSLQKNRKKSFHFR